MNLYQIKLTDNQITALEHLFAQGIIWSKTELSEAWDELREQVKEATNTVAIINAIQDAKCNCTKASDPAMKYDPCRKFRKGDKAKPRIINGRENQKMPLNVIFTVIGDEDEYGAVAVEYMSPSRGLLTSTTVHAVWLELLTPVEELERYILIHNKNEKYYEVCWKDDDEPDGQTGRTRCRATYWYHLPPQTYSQKEAKAAAEAERDRLNAEYRKEQK